MQEISTQGGIYKEFLVRSPRLTESIAPSDDQNIGVLSTSPIEHAERIPIWPHAIILAGRPLYMGRELAPGIMIIRG